jgi:hypothetical protein
MKGTFKTPEGETVLEGVDFSLTTKGGSHSFSEWFGSFRTARSNDFVPDEYRLELSDGRFGNVIVNRCKSSEILLNRGVDKTTGRNGRTEYKISSLREGFNLS